MAYFRLNLFLLLFFAGAFQLVAQKNPVLYAGFEYYRHTGFEGNSFGSFSAGAQIYQWKFLAPEIGVDHYFGNMEERDIHRESTVGGMAPAIFKRRFTANVLTLSPKIKIGRKDAFITFSPKYHIGHVSATGRYFLLDPDYSRYELAEEQRETVPVSFWSFSLGIEGLAIQTEKYWFTLFLTYTEVDSREAFRELDFSEREVKVYSTHTNTIGFGVRFYYNPFPSEND